MAYSCAEVTPAALRWPPQPAQLVGELGPTIACDRLASGLLQPSYPVLAQLLSRPSGALSLDLVSDEAIVGQEHVLENDLY